MDPILPLLTESGTSKIFKDMADWRYDALPHLDLLKVILSWKTSRNSGEEIMSMAAPLKKDLEDWT